MLTKDGKWICYKPSSDSFVVMIGDSLHAWSNGRRHSPFHHMMMSGNEARYSIGLFSIPKGGSIIKALEELVDEEHPLFSVQFLKYYYTKKSQIDQFAQCTYYGV
ncbi:2-oxoglutarate-dependent dioxygenase AOP1 [Spatholobus suberectus]|nr:2-oxoglutarate-dependent dioxygenase AOP1 [Spatholobus suberectus]